MKDYRDIAEDIFERREQYIVRKIRRRKAFARTAASICCTCLVALLGFSMWKSGVFGTTQDASGNIGTDGLNDSTQENSNNRPSETGNNNPSGSADAEIGNYPDNYTQNGSEKTMISSFDTGEASSGSYAVPENGKFAFSVPLREAMNEYGDSVLYRVVVDVFSNGEQLSPDSVQVQDECKRLSDMGYTVAYETYFDGESYHYYFTLHADYDEVTKFAVNEGYGYFMFLYDERVEQTGESPIAAYSDVQ